MGLDITIPWTRPGPSWTRLAAEAQRRGVPLQLRMIDGLPALPGEEPADDWGELRVAAPAGMITLRRVDAGIQLVTWGNADAPLLAARDVLADAIAAAGG
jgi:hypothetical protein